MFRVRHTVVLAYVNSEETKQIILVVFIGFKRLKKKIQAYCYNHFFVYTAFSFLRGCHVPLWYQIFLSKGKRKKVDTTSKHFHHVGVRQNVLKQANINQPHLNVARAAFALLQDTAAALCNKANDSRPKSKSISLGVQSNENVTQNLPDTLKKWLYCSIPDAATCSLSRNQPLEDFCAVCLAAVEEMFGHFGVYFTNTYSFAGTHKQLHKLWSFLIMCYWHCGGLMV